MIIALYLDYLPFHALGIALIFYGGMTRRHSILNIFDTVSGFHICCRASELEASVRICYAQFNYQIHAMPCALIWQQSAQTAWGRL